jgi:nicotinate-nucleotide adenylyltransferase
MSLGIFGGTFDPPHLVHLILAEECLYQLNLDRILWVLTPDPPHKQGRHISSQEVRREMLEVALEGNRAFEVSRVDIDRPPPHYALDTVRLLRQAHPFTKLVYLMGSDSLFDLPTWHQPVKFVAACDGIGVMQRPGDPSDLSALEKVIPGLTTKIHFIEAPLLGISSSDIRKRVSEGKPYRYFLPLGVDQIIQQSELYKSLS